MTDKNSGTLYVVATPIGNLRDITLRALDVLGAVAVIAAEDTRHTRQLLSAHNIKAGGRLVSLNADAERRRVPELVERLAGGDDVAVVSNAGTPGSSDPGGALVSAARARGIPVRPVPGASAAIAAFSTCGAPGSYFVFDGFLPRTAAKREARLKKIAAETRPVVLFESPLRVRGTLEDLYRACGDREVSLHREMTKIHEESSRIRLRDVVENLVVVTEKGEYTIVVMPAESESAVIEDDDAKSESVAEAVRALMHRGLSARDAAEAAAEILGLPRNAVYRVAKNLNSD